MGQVEGKRNLTRSEMMARIGRRDTRPERTVRSALHRAGYRFRLCRPDLPGCPDIVLPRYRTVIFVHGCFWHQHANCRRATKPKSNVQFWENKLLRNRGRDEVVMGQLRDASWNALIVWECELREVGWDARLINALMLQAALAS